MRKLLFSLIFILALLTPILAPASFVKETSANPTVENCENLKLTDFIKISPNDFCPVLAGKKMNIWDKISFTIMKMDMKKEIKKNPNILVSEYYLKAKQKRLGWGWWVLIGVAVLAILFAIATAATLSSWN